MGSAIHRLDDGNSITVPLARVDDLSRVGAAAAQYGAILGRSVEIVSIVSPDDDFAEEFRRLSASVQGFADSIDQTIRFHLISHESLLNGVLESCRDRLTCMATAASPFHNEHYVGSFAASLLRESTAPVILVGPSVTEAQVAPSTVVVAVATDIDSHASMLTGQTFARAIGAPMTKVVIDPTGIVYETDYHDPSVAFSDEVHAAMSSGPLTQNEITTELVERSQAAMLVVATRAQQGLSWICEGSVSFDATGLTSHPVIAVGPNAFDEDVANEHGRFPLQAKSATFVAIPASAR